MLCIDYLNWHLEKVDNSNFSKGFLIGESSKYASGLLLWTGINHTEDKQVGTWKK